MLCLEKNVTHQPHSCTLYLSVPSTHLSPLPGCFFTRKNQLSLHTFVYYNKNTKKSTRRRHDDDTTTTTITTIIDRSPVNAQRSQRYRSTIVRESKYTGAVSSSRSRERVSFPGQSRVHAHRPWQYYITSFVGDWLDAKIAEFS